MKKVFVVLSCVFASNLTSLASTQAMRPPDQDEVKVAVERTQAIKTKIDDEKSNPRFVRTLTNVQVELTFSDQTGTAAPDKKTVNMVVSSGNWGKIRSTANARPAPETPLLVQLNVDARPLVAVDGPIQLELTLSYAPPGAQTLSINQSLTVVLQSGKPLVISQAADPISDRRVAVEVKATVLK